MKVTNGDKLIGSLRSILLDETASEPTRELVNFILKDLDVTRHRHRLGSLMVVCQRIFEDSPESLMKMILMVSRGSPPEND